MTERVDPYPEWRWLASTRRLQEETFRVDYETLRTDGDVLADYLTENYAAAAIELGEFMAEVGWKPWSTPRGWVNREAAVKELVDVAHFIANLACALNVTDDEWELRYRQKQQVNRRRQAQSYDSRVGKCQSCGRALDDLGVKSTGTSAEPQHLLCLCGETVTLPAGT